MPKYFFILGTNPALSASELVEVLKNSAGCKITGNALLYDDEIEDPAVLIRRLGGSVKIGRITGQTTPNDKKGMRNLIMKMIECKAKPGVKFNFGFSEYGGRTGYDYKGLAMEVKTEMKNRGVNARWVRALDSTALTSVQAEQNRLTRDGLEAVVIRQGNWLLIGETAAVQPFKELSYRDYGRPGRDDESGMLPPKLAQIMINLSGITAQGVLLDPFCGSGTILTEAALMGYRELFASDISEKAVKDTEKNMDWIKNKFGIPKSNFTAAPLSGTELSKKFGPDSIDAIVTEPYLGPQRGKIDFKKTVAELERLYSKSIKEFSLILKKNGRVVMIWPVFTSLGKNIFLNPDTAGLIKVQALPSGLFGGFRTGNNIPGLTSRGTLLYGRPGQRVWREIVILRKN